MRVTREVRAASGRQSGTLPLIIEFTKRVPLWTDEEWDAAYEAGYDHGREDHEEEMARVEEDGDVGEGGAGDAGEAGDEDD